MKAKHLDNPVMLWEKQTLKAHILHILELWTFN